MTNEQIIFNEVCSNYDSAQRHDLVSRFYTAEQVQGIAAGLELVPDDNGNTPDPIESAESLLCAGLFHTWAEWHRDGLTVKRGEKAAITCELWKFNDKKKQPAPDADELTKAAAEQDKGYYYLAKAHLFHRGQVEKQQPKPAGRFQSLDEIRAYNKMLADQRKAAKAAAQQDKLQVSRNPPNRLPRPPSRKQRPARPISREQSGKRCTNLWPCPKRTAPPKRKRWQSGARLPKPGKPQRQPHKPPHLLPRRNPKQSPSPKQTPRPAQTAPRHTVSRFLSAEWDTPAGPHPEKRPRPTPGTPPGPFEN